MPFVMSFLGAGAFFAVSFLQPGSTMRAMVTTIADTSTSTFRLNVVISFPFFTEFTRFAYVRSTSFPFLPHQTPGDSFTSIADTLCLFAKPCHHPRDPTQGPTLLQGASLASPGTYLFCTP